MKIPGLCFMAPTTKFTLFWVVENWIFSYISTNEAFMTLLLLPVLPYFSQFYSIKMHISWNISNLCKVSSLKMHWETCFHLVYLNLTPKCGTLCINWINSKKCALLLNKVVKNKVKQAKVAYQKKHQLSNENWKFGLLSS